MFLTFTIVLLTSFLSCNLQLTNTQNIIAKFEKKDDNYLEHSTKTYKMIDLAYLPKELKKPLCSWNEFKKELRESKGQNKADKIAIAFRQLLLKKAILEIPNFHIPSLYKQLEALRKQREKEQNLRGQAEKEKERTKKEVVFANYGDLFFDSSKEGKLHGDFFGDSTLESVTGYFYNSFGRLQFYSGQLKFSFYGSKEAKSDIDLSVGFSVDKDGTCLKTIRTFNENEKTHFNLDQYNNIVQYGQDRKEDQKKDNNNFIKKDKRKLEKYILIQYSKRQCETKSNMFYEIHAGNIFLQKFNSYFTNQYGLSSDALIDTNAYLRITQLKD